MRRSTAIITTAALVALMSGCVYESPSSVPNDGAAAQKALASSTAVLTPTALATSQGLTADGTAVLTATRSRVTVTVTGLAAAGLVFGPGACPEPGVLVAPLATPMTFRVGGVTTSVSQATLVTDPVLNPAGAITVVNDLRSDKGQTVPTIQAGTSVRIQQAGKDLFRGSF